MMYFSHHVHSSPSSTVYHVTFNGLFTPFHPMLYVIVYLTNSQFAVKVFHHVLHFVIFAVVVGVA